MLRIKEGVLGMTLWNSSMVSPRDERRRSSETTRKSPVFNKRVGINAYYYSGFYVAYHVLTCLYATRAPETVEWLVLVEGMSRFLLCML